MASPDACYSAADEQYLFTFLLRPILAVKPEVERD
jgi:hypothetical protein